MNSNLTENETKVLRALANNYFEGGIWSDCIDNSRTPSKLSATSLGGVVASLSKKGIVSTDFDFIEITELGPRVIIEITELGQRVIQEMGLMK